MRKVNPATGTTICKYDWEDKLSETEKAGVKMWRDAGLPDNALVSKLVVLLDNITETQGGQLALQEKK